uniref:Fas apoptotic inhibitory molecule 1 n=1 Tax=Parastrongyloides trichosuri TaxID=131310 RepID=A0A0N4ZUS6_PARTI
MDSECSDLVATWNVPMSKKVYKIEFEHGTTTGRRVVKIDGEVIINKNWQFKLVGKETFRLENAICSISIDALGIFSYEYSLEVAGKTFEKFQEQQKKSIVTWHTYIMGVPARICLDKDSMEVWVNGKKIETAGEFVDDGTETHFVFNNTECCIKNCSSGKKKIGVIHKLYINGKEINEEDKIGDIETS